MPQLNVDEHFADTIFNYIFLKVNFHILINFSKECVPEGLINSLRPSDAHMRL